MDKYDYERIDKAVSKRIDDIYSDPKRHKFESYFQVYSEEAMYGPRGGKLKGKKSICFHCGTKKKGHVEVTESL